MVRRCAQVFQRSGYSRQRFDGDLSHKGTKHKEKVQNKLKLELSTFSLCFLCPLWPKLRDWFLRAVALQNELHVVACFAVRRDRVAILHHRAFAGVVSSQRQV